MLPHLSRVLKHRVLLSSSSSSSAAFSTSKRSYPRCPKAPAPEQLPEKDGQKDALEAAAVERGAGWQREKLPSELTRPPTIPFQPRVANAVRLVGTVGAPVQLQRLPDGRFSAVSVLVQDRRADFPKFWIPIIFQDDLAQVAASHLQENDLVYVSGQLTGDVPPFKLTDDQANIQVLAHLLSFVDSKSVETDIMVDEEEVITEVVEAEKTSETKKFNSKYPLGTVAGYNHRKDKLSKLWNDVIARPQDWTDNRAEKKNGSRSAKYPDFKNNVSQEPLWLDSAPTWVLERLDGLVFGDGRNFVNQQKPPTEDAQKGRYTSWVKSKRAEDASAVSKQKLEADLWQNLVGNPKNWWDNRSNKFKKTAPDFKHKETGQALWIGPTTPKWAMDALPPVKTVSSKGTGKQKDGIGIGSVFVDTLLS